MTTALFAPTPLNLRLFRRTDVRPFASRVPLTTLGTGYYSRYNSLSLCPCSASTPPSTVEVEREDAATIAFESNAVEDGVGASRSGCKACGREEIESGCNGEGTIQGGIATVPGFGWWPIKAYRPCPGFVASGGRYVRRGQSMDEVVSGQGGRSASASFSGLEDETEDSKKRRGPRRFKR